MEAQLDGPAPSLPDEIDFCGEPSSNTLPLSDGLLQTLSALRTTGPNRPPAAPEPPPRGQVCLNMEVLSDNSVKALFLGLYIGVGLSFTALVLLTVVKFVPTWHVFKMQKVVLWMNTAVALLMLVALTGMLGVFSCRLKRVHETQLVWSDRRKRMAWLQCLDLVSQTLNSFFYLLPNLYGLTKDCVLFNPPVHYCAFLRFTMWNNAFLVFVVKARVFNLWEGSGCPNQKKRSDRILLDASLWHHWKLGLYWLAFEIASMYTLLHVGDEFDASCEKQGQRCVTSTEVVVGICSITALAIGYQVLIMFFLLKSWRQLKQKSYTDFRWTNVAVKFHFRSMGPVGDFVILSVILLWLLWIGSCDSYLLSWFGLLPVETAMSIQAIVNGIFWLPLEPKEGRYQRFENKKLCWTEREAMASKKKVFQFELAVKLYYWCELVYTYDPVVEECRGPFRLSLGKELFGLQNHVCFRVREVDTNVIIAWNQQTIVVSFRGTSSFTNFRENIRIWRGIHPPKRGKYVKRTRPLVHVGFYKSWTTGNLNYKVINRIIQIVYSAEFNSRNTQVLVTGHSLGGALAVLASYDIARYCGVAPSRISCYTFGAPRVGNHAFANDYMGKVPDTWQIINDSDFVTRTPKLVFVYKHVGEKVIINKDGDIILSPLFMEINLHRAVRYQWEARPFHLLSSYRKSLVAIVKAQFIKNKGLPGGMEAMMKLLEEGHRHLVDILDVTRHSTRLIAERGSHYWEFTRTTNRRQRIGRLQRAGTRVARYFSCLECFGAFKRVISSQDRPSSERVAQFPGSFQASSTISNDV